MWIEGDIAIINLQFVSAIQQRGNAIKLYYPTHTDDTGNDVVQANGVDTITFGGDEAAKKFYDKVVKELGTITKGRGPLSPDGPA